jgi:hypothetical protein
MWTKNIYVQLLFLLILKISDDNLGVFSLPAVCLDLYYATGFNAVIQ